MVTRAGFFVAFLAVCLVSSTAGLAQAQSNLYTVNHEWVQIFINDDGTIDLTYNMSITVTQGRLTAFDVGQPNRDFTIGQATDQYGNQLRTYSYTPDVASVDFKQQINAGESIWYTITTNVAGMIYNDTTNPGNYGMQFLPQWISDTPISDVRIQIVLPPGVSTADVKTTEVFYNGTSMVEGRLAVYWEKPSLVANERFMIGVSFPAAALPNYTPSSQGGSGDGFDLDSLFLVLGVIGFFAAILIFIFIIYKLSKSSYQSPKVSMETLGVKRGLTAVEAAYLLGLKPPQLVTAILYSLLQKRAVWAEETKPSLKLKVLPPYENKTGTKESPLRYYEIDFLQALKADGSLDEEKLAKAIMFLRDTVEKKLEGYSRKDTVDYYRKIVDKAWAQVEQAGTPELASNAYDKELLWLMMDPNQRVRTETVFRDRPFQPNPLWFWWWYGYTIYHPHPVFHPNINAPAQSPTPTPIPGAEFANNIATSLEKTSSNIVVSLEKFANAIVPPPPKASHAPAHKGSDCVCACAACACACACVSCACACAGGGGR
ncbi:MAG: DUF2207 domain-containing protein [Candidatus Bathyarchaeota archaeon]|nr:DUF2207 domain-containing protein [Candidatus Bathyarchaeota archaeon]